MEAKRLQIRANPISTTTIKKLDRFIRKGNNRSARIFKQDKATVKELQRELKSR